MVVKQQDLVEDDREGEGRGERDKWSCRSGESLSRLPTCQRATCYTISRSVVISSGTAEREALCWSTG